MARVPSEKKNLNRLAGEFLVASRLAQRGYMVTLQWGTSISYDILVLDKRGAAAFLEVKSTASNPRKWILQAKYGWPERDSIPVKRRFVCCVDLTLLDSEPDVFVFPAAVVAKGLHYYYQGHFPNSPSFVMDLSSRPRGKARDQTYPPVSRYIDAERYLERYDILAAEPVLG